MPGVLLIETMAQASGFLLLARIGFSQMPLLAAIKQAKLRRFVGPGEQLRVVSRILHEGSGFAVAQGQIACNERTVSEAEITLRVLPFPDPGLREQLQQMARQIGLPLGTTDAG
jgi:3-hydroxyacyl-[acyl-carrier-protein] dehydratase